MSSSESSRASLPATSALVMEVSTIRSVEERSSSRALMAVVRSARRRSFRALMRAIVAALPNALPPRSCGARSALGALAGAGLTAYAAWEARQYTLRRVTVPLLPPATRRSRCCTSATSTWRPDQRAKQEWLRGLADLEPDLVINTGDNLAHTRSVPVVADALGGLLDVPGVYVLGSNDYYAPGMRNPLLYLLPDTGKRHTRPPAALARPQGAVRRGRLARPDQRLRVAQGAAAPRIAFAGVDDPHLGYDDLTRVAGPADPVGRRTARRHARAVPPGARPVRRRRLRRDHRRPHPRRPGVPARAVAR